MDTCECGSRAAPSLLCTQLRDGAVDKQHHYITSACNANTLRDGGGLPRALHRHGRLFLTLTYPQTQPSLATTCAGSTVLHHPAIAQLKVYHVVPGADKCRSSGLYAALNASALMARGQMRLNKSGGWSNCCRMAGIHLWICKATSPGRRCGCCANQCVWYAYRAVLQFPQRVSELLSFWVSDHVASVYSSTLPPTPRLLSPLRTRVLREMFSLSHFLLTVSFLHHTPHAAASS
jgi:hypothetical protein